MPLQTFSNSNRNKTIALGVAIFVVYTIIPNMIDEFEKTSEEGKKESIEFAREADKLLGASLGIYCIYELFTMIRRDFLRYLN